ncbi:uncharacterized protein LOC143919004 [Arctopsyche grandis]|uniref:uncharacterized protein LOC143919004 n=1 Tax=Arctopsyche grandis TaxID=121162 RepID=UPI00406D7064
MSATSNKHNKIKRKRRADSQTEPGQNEENKPETISEQNDSAMDVDKPPKKKPKKKKKPAEEQKSDVPESKMSKRQLKREKHAQRIAEQEAAAHKAVQLQAISYLSLWKHNKAEWKFNKVKQIWLYKHKFESDKVPEELWQPFIEYFSSATGAIKKSIIEDCQKIIEVMDKWIEANKEAEVKEKKPSEVAYQRARDLLQHIHS